MARAIFLGSIMCAVAVANAGAQYVYGAVTPPALYSDERDLLVRLAIVARQQVELGSMGLQKATRPDVTAFARVMLADYARADAELAVLADGMNVETRVVDERARALVRRLDRLDGREFERDYAQAMFETNQDVVSMLRIWTIETSKRALDDPFTRWTSDMLPRAEQYLEKARQLQQAVK